MAMLTAEWLKKNGIRHTVDNGKISVAWSLDLRDTSITALPNNLSVDWSLDLAGTSITALPNNLSVGRSLGLLRTSVTALPNNLSVGWSLYFESSITLNGDTLNVRLIDGIPTIVGSFKSFNGVDVCKAWYARDFGPEKPIRRKSNLCYVAQSLGVFAHGDTMRQAVDDLTYKLKATEGKRAAIEDAVKAGGFDMPTWRAASGACQSGTVAWLRDKGVYPTPEFLPMADAKRLMSGSFYGQSVIDAIDTLESDAA